MKNIVLSTVLALGLGGFLQGCAFAVGKRYPPGMVNGHFIVCTPCIEIPNNRGTGFGFVWY